MAVAVENKPNLNITCLVISYQMFWLTFHVNGNACEYLIYVLLIDADPVFRGLSSTCSLMSSSRTTHPYYTRGQKMSHVSKRFTEYSSDALSSDRLRMGGRCKLGDFLMRLFRNTSKPPHKTKLGNPHSLVDLVWILLDSEPNTFGCALLCFSGFSSVFLDARDSFNIENCCLSYPQRSRLSALSRGGQKRLSITVNPSTHL